MGIQSADLNVYFDGHLDNLRSVSSLVERVCRRLKLDDTTSYHVELAVVEAVTNCIRHAFGGEDTRPMHVGAHVKGDNLLISVTDRGQPAELAFSQGDDDRVIPDELEEGGRGLFLISSLMDRVEHRCDSRGNTLLMTKALR